jgi:hypothetical protein
MSNLPPISNWADQFPLIEPPIETPIRAAQSGVGDEFVIKLKPKGTPGAISQFLARDGTWVDFASTSLSSWGSIVGDIQNQGDLWAELQSRPLISSLAPVAFSGVYNDLTGKPVFGDLAFINKNNQASYFLNGMGQWAIPSDLFAKWGNINGNLADQSDLIAKFNQYAALDSPIFTGVPQAPTQPVDDATTKLATTAFVLGQAFNGSPVMDGTASSGDSTRWARGNHRHPTDTTRAPLDSPQFIGLPTAPTPVAGNDSQLLATTAFVKTALAGFTGGIPEAPLDGQTYGRKSAAWAVVLGKQEVYVQPGEPAGAPALRDVLWVDTDEDIPWGQYLPLSGGTLTGPLTILRTTPVDAYLSLNGPAGTVRAIYWGTGASTRWGMWASSDAETGTNAGSTFTISRFNDAGAWLGDAVLVNRANGATTIQGLLSVQQGSGSDSRIHINKSNIDKECAVTGILGGLFRWNMALGNAAPETGGNTGSNFSLNRYNDAGVYIDTPIHILRSTGATAFGAAIQTNRWYGGPAEIEIWPAGSAASGQPSWPTTNGAMVAIRHSAGGNYGAGAVSCYSGSGSTGVSLLNGANAWSVVSDERLKNIDSEITDGLLAVLAFRSIRFRYKTDTEGAPMRVGLSAQSVQPSVPEAVEEAPVMGSDGNVTEEKYLNLRLQEVIPHMVNAIQTLAARVQALEAAA